MWTAQWTCRRCVQALATPYSALFLRYASTEAIRLPPALLQRARSLATEHGEIQKALAAEFDTQKAKRLGEISSVATALKEWEAAKSSIAELSNMLKSDDKELQILARDELASTHDRLERLGRNLTAALTPKHPFANLPCLIEIRPGPGGLEGRYFTYTLFRMYKQYCQRKGFRMRVVRYEISDAGGTAAESGETPLTEAIIEVLDPGAYDEFRAEAGMHRVQRIPVGGTEKNGRTHSSAVALWVLPSPGNESATEEADFEDPGSIFYIDPAEVKSEKMRASGAGGQHVNKTESAVRLTHIPTGIVVSMQDSRSQHKNREAAWKLLRSRLAQKRREEREEEAASLRNTVLSKDKITRAGKIRTYNYGQDRCTDHRAGLDVHNLPDLLKGGEMLDKVIEAAKEWIIQREIRVFVAEEEAKENAVGKDAGAGAKKDKK